MTNTMHWCIVCMHCMHCMHVCTNMCGYSYIYISIHATYTYIYVYIQLDHHTYSHMHAIMYRSRVKAWQNEDDQIGTMLSLRYGWLCIAGGSQGQPSQQTLRTLNLYVNGLTLVFARALSIFLQGNSNLTSLCLHTNPLKYQGVIDLANILQTSTALADLDLSETQMTDVGVSAIAKSLHHNRTLCLITISLLELYQLMSMEPKHSHRHWQSTHLSLILILATILWLARACRRYSMP